MKSVEFNGRVQDLNRIEKQNKVVPGCGNGPQHDEAPVASHTHQPKSPKPELHSQLLSLTRSSTLDAPIRDIIEPGKTYFTYLLHHCLLLIIKVVT